MKRRTSLRDVAQAAGVHLSTASRALNPRTEHLLTPALVAEIREISRRLDYRPNAAAHSLRTNRTRTIGVVVPDITNPVFPPIIRGIEDGLQRSGYVAILANADGRLDREAAILDMLRARGVDGLVLASVELEDDAVSRLAADGLPLVTVNRRVADPAVSSVVNDEAAGVRDVLRHLTLLGHRRIATIAGPQAISTGRQRYLAFEQQRRELGLDDDSRLVAFAAGFNEAEGSAGAEALFRTGSGFTALVAANDRLALGALDTCRRHGLACPRDVSVTGFNDMPLVDRVSPPLTTIRIHHYEVGFDAAGILIGLIETPAGERRPRHEVRPVALVVRGSTAPPPA